MAAASAQPGSVNHLRLTVGDMAVSRGFYDRLARHLGYSLVEAGADRVAWAGMTASGSLQWLIISAAAPERRSRRHDRAAPGLHHIAWNASSRSAVDALYRDLVSAGATILDPPAEYAYEPGYYAVFFEDPDGIKLELVHVPVAGSRRYWQAFEDRGRNPLDEA